jgi:UDP-N-acetylglucosamine acyltransferase
MAIDPTAQIADSARVAPGAQIGANVQIADFCVIEDDVVIGDGCRFEPHVFVKRWTTLGRNNAVSAGTVLGSDPLDKSFVGKRSFLDIGDDNVIREHYTISRGTEPESKTVIGDRNYIMTSGHIAHNCTIGNDNVIASTSLVAGHVEIGNNAFVSGGIGIHQFSKVGDFAMLAGSTRVNKDVPPYFLYGGLYVTPMGVNTVGLKRAGFSATDISTLKKAFRLLFRSRLSVDESLARIEAECEGEYAANLVQFVRSSNRGICRRNGGA